MIRRATQWVMPTGERERVKGKVEKRMIEWIASRIGPITDEPQTWDYRHHLLANGKLSEDVSRQQYLWNSCLLALDLDRDGIVVASAADVVGMLDVLNDRFAEAVCL